MDISPRTTLRQVYDTRHDTKKMFVSLTTKFTLRSYILKDGTSQVYLHIHSAGERERLALDLYIKKADWNTNKQRARDRKDGKYDDFNLVLDNLHASITEIKTQFRLSKNTLTLKKFVHEFKSDFSRLDFLAFFLTSLKSEKKILKPGSYNRNMSVYHKLTEFKKQIYFSDIDSRMINEIRNHLTKIGNAKSTIESNFSVIRKYLRLAKRYGIHFPLDLADLKVKNIRGNRVSLQPISIKKLYDYFESSFIPDERRLICGYFLFSCFTGLRIGDLQQLERHQISSSFKIITRKNQKSITINLTEKAKHILEIEPRLFNDRLTDQYMNREIKKIAVSVGIKDKISFHVARHSFATNYLRMGGNVVYLKKLLGHSDIKTTMIYESITSEEANKEIHLLDDMF